MKYTPNPRGEFAGQLGYGYRSIEAFIDAVDAIQTGEKTVIEFNETLPTIHTTLLTTAILEAGRISLDSKCMPVSLDYDGESCHPKGLTVLGGN
mmetsp:Transcript_22683/g.36150  ORF Transcript_22683/g.36150 Transcript_22683/m.36150 type:complete len:94 (-) Transcript_22683:2328-2609(-)